MAPAPLTIGVHASGLARAQAERVAQLLTSGGVPFGVNLEIVAEAHELPVGLHDDHIAESRSEIRQLQRLLRDEHVDMIIHRGFDLRGDVPDDLRVVAIVPRGNPHLVLIGPLEITFDELDEGQCVGVVHFRERAQLLGYRPDLEYELVRGDASDWLTSLIDGRIDALVAPGAAIEHLRLQERVSEIFPPDLLVPAPGSGILVCVARAGDAVTAARLKPLHDRGTAVEYTAECALIESLGNVWDRPVGALARLHDDHLEMTAMVASADGEQILRENHRTASEDPCLSGAEIAALLLERGADRLLSELDEDDDASFCDIAGQLPQEEADWDED